MRNGANIEEKNVVYLLNLLKFFHFERKCEEKPVDLVKSEEKCPFVDYLKKNNYLTNKNNDEMFFLN